MLLAAQDEPALQALYMNLERDGHYVAFQQEPDFGWELTAIAVGDTAQAALRHLPLALGGGEKNESVQESASPHH